MTTKGMGEGYWKAAGGDSWARLNELMDRLYAPVTEAILASAAPGQGERILDIGCGGGATTLETARQLGPDGVCLGVDVSTLLLEIARHRAIAAGLDNARFVLGDAGSQVFDGPFDGAISRFGVMFFEDPDVAFAHIRRCIRPGGRMVFACWRGPSENPFSGLATEAAAPFLPPLPQAPPDSPGRFAFADPDRVRGILERSGWRDIDIQPLDTPTPASVEDMVRMGLGMGPTGAALPGLEAPIRERIEQAVRARITQESRAGVVPMEAACWLVSATA